MRRRELGSALLAMLCVATALAAPRPRRPSARDLPTGCSFAADSTVLASCGEFEGGALDLTSCGLTGVSATAFWNLTSLFALLLQSNALPGLPPGVFSRCGGLRQLSLANNLLTNVSGLLTNLSNLAVLDVRENRIARLAAADFGPLTALSQLDARENCIVEVEWGAFSNASVLEVLYLSSNNITALPAGLFANASALRSLDLSGNELTAVEEGLLRGLGSLTSLGLASNKISFVADGALATSTPRLNALDLRFNALAAIGPSAVANLTGLYELWLEGNAILQVDARAFVGLTALQTMTLSDNLLTGLPAGVFDDLRDNYFLYLDGNEFGDLSGGVLRGMRRLMQLDLGYNFLTSVPPLSGLPALATLTLTGNRITALAPGDIPYSTCMGCAACSFAMLMADARAFCASGGAALSAELPRAAVSTLGLSSNLIARVSPGLNMTSLRSIDLTDNLVADIVPGSFAGAMRLLSLTLEENLLASLAPGAFAGATSLQRLSLSGNLLGAVPLGLGGDLPALDTLDVSFNLLSGDFPADLCTMVSLRCAIWGGGAEAACSPTCARGAPGF